MNEPRIEREQAFHDGRVRAETRVAAWKFYAVAQTSAAYYRDCVLSDCADKRVLEYGCGTGSYALDLARGAATVTGIDIAPLAIDRARDRAAAEGLAERASFHVMNAEALTFAPGTFDRICGNSILHHLDLAKALAEIRRVLKPDGNAVFFEPLGHNPLINLYRRLTPRMRSVDEHPLTSRDLDTLRAFFGGVEIRHFHLLSLAAVAWRRLPGFEGLLRCLEAVDRGLFRAPFVRRQAWIAVIKLSAPIRTPRGEPR
jgi:SAM-dependent methyltransferase